MSAVHRWFSVAVAGVALAAAAGCGGSDSAKGRAAHADGFSACVRAWNRPANFEHGRPGARVRRLEPRPAVPLFAHLSGDRRGRCVIFLDTPSTVDDRRYIRTGAGYSLDCAGACGQQVPRGARTFQFRRDGSLPAP